MELTNDTVSQTLTGISSAESCTDEYQCSFRERTDNAMKKINITLTKGSLYPRDHWP